MKLKFCAKFDKTQITEKRARFSWKNINLTFIKGWLTCDHFKCSVMNYCKTWTLMTETLILFVSIIQTFEIQNNQYWILHRITSHHTVLIVWTRIGIRRSIILSSLCSQCMILEDFIPSIFKSDPATIKSRRTITQFTQKLTQPISNNQPRWTPFQPSSSSLSS